MHLLTLLLHILPLLFRHSDSDPEPIQEVMLTPKSKFSESRRTEKPMKDYDMRYVVNELDKAHHEIADEDSSWIVTQKHFVPECFYGYSTVHAFLTDPLPNLTKLKQKYCMYSQKKGNYID